MNRRSGKKRLIIRKRRLFGRPRAGLKFTRNRHRYYDGLIFYGQYTGYIRLRCTPKLSSIRVREIIEYSKRREPEYLKN